MKNQLKLLENKYRKIFLIVTCIAIFTQINWALRHDFNDIAVRIAIAIPAAELERVKIAVQNFGAVIKLFSYFASFSF